MYLSRPEFLVLIPFFWAGRKHCLISEKYHKNEWHLRLVEHIFTECSSWMFFQIKTKIRTLFLSNSCHIETTIYHYFPTTTIIKPIKIFSIFYCTPTKDKKNQECNNNKWHQIDDNIVFNISIKQYEKRLNGNVNFPHHFHFQSINKKNREFFLKCFIPLVNISTVKMSVKNKKNSFLSRMPFSFYFPRFFFLFYYHSFLQKIEKS